ncbi:interleukin 12 receptor, beta 2a, like [Chaetodon trifascialis]|uniref:interleukin 12 receptor, beta 2a, like n=1 Tax=Chaetodon trifascialis TaxID=109706 RepID=UPI0039918ABB
MATFQTGWLLSILLINLPTCFAVAGPPAPPPAPECYIPCDEKDCRKDIHCTWNARLEPQIPTNYSLHWKAADSKDQHVISGTGFSGYIQRVHFNHGDLCVWVQAKNQHGSAKSQEVVYNTANIIKPPSPEVTPNPHDQFEIDWKFNCDQLLLSMGHCDVRHRAEADHIWQEEEGGFYGSYTLNNPKNCTAYELQVRCACGTTLRSDWSPIHRIQGTEKTPDGELDVWRDCGTSPASSDCVLTWKNLSTVQACGHILGYEVKLSYKNGTVVLVNVSTAESKGQLLCDARQCHFPSSLKDASSVSISAYNAHGATVPSYLAMPVSGKEKNEQAFRLKMTEENLTVSWNLPSQSSDNLKEYVVQYKQAASLPGRGFDWVKVNKSQTTAFFEGRFEHYTPYQVSLFTVSHSREVLHLSTVTGYSLEGTPPKVTLFNTISLAATNVTLLWEPAPLSQQRGVILYYQIGVDKQKVLKVSASPQHENKTIQLTHLSPGQEYEVWIKAVTAAGPGGNVTIRFKTKDDEDSVYFRVLVVICVLVICVLIVLVSACLGKCKVCPLVPPCFSNKVPDPRNSCIFREMKHQINDPMAWICIPIHEPHPKISLLEVVQVETWASKSSQQKASDVDGLFRPVVGDRSSHMDCQDDQREDAVTEECHRTDFRCGREAYSKMVDSDEERDREEEDREDCWSSSEDEQCTSGYEKHFMPTASEILEVS